MRSTLGNVRTWPPVPQPPDDPPTPPPNDNTPGGVTTPRRS
ncbi:hypothetical protein [Streptomyces sp. UG1]